MHSPNPSVSVSPEVAISGQDPAPLRVAPLTPEQHSVWNEFLAARPQYALSHHLGWDGVYAAYRLPAFRLAAWRDDRLVGVLPLAAQRSRLFGSQLVSLPWLDAAGVLAEDEAARSALLQAALELARSSRLAQVQLRQRERVAAWPHCREDKVLMRLELEAEPEALWKRFNPKVRNQVRKAEKSGLCMTTGGAELLDELYAVYSENMRDLGSPSHSRRLLAAVLSSFVGQARIHVARVEGQLAGAGLTLHGPEQVEIPWASSFRRFNALCVNHLLYWHILAQACRDGARWFHFGRSTLESGTYHFKKQWGAEPVPLYWHLFRSDGRTPDTTPPQEGHGKAVAVWTRLPLWITRRAGPWLMAQLP